MQRLGYGKPLKLVTTCMKPHRHDTYLASLCPSRRCQKHIASIDKFVYGYIEDEEEKKQAGRLIPFHLALLLSFHHLQHQRAVQQNHVMAERL